MRSATFFQIILFVSLFCLDWFLKNNIRSQTLVGEVYKTSMPGVNMVHIREPLQANNLVIYAMLFFLLLGIIIWACRKYKKWLALTWSLPFLASAVLIYTVDFFRLGYNTKYFQITKFFTEPMALNLTPVYAGLGIVILTITVGALVERTWA